MRRDPPFEYERPAFLADQNGSGVLVSGVPESCINIRSLTLTSTGGAATADFAYAGTVFKSLAVSAGGSETIELDQELPAGSGLDVVTSAAVDVGAQYVLLDCSIPITKEQARAATYAASLTSPKATRTPNRFGGQVEG